MNENMENIENLENLETEVVSENVEQVTEETAPAAPAKTFTQEELNAAVGKAKARTRAKVEREFQKKYGGLETVLRAGTGKESVEEITESFTDFYTQKGIQLPSAPTISDRDARVLAEAEANDIINAGYDEVVEEVDRLAKLGVDKMSAQDKVMFEILGNHRNAVEVGRQLAQIGVPESVYNSQEFKNFAGMFARTTPITEVYKLYAKNVKPAVEPIGSMKNGSHDEGKTFYTPEEVDKLTPKDYDNPVIFQRVRDSMKLWK